MSSLGIIAIVFLITCLPLLTSSQFANPPYCLTSSQAQAPSPRDCTELLDWFLTVARRSSSTQYIFGRHVNMRSEHAIELPFIISRPESPSCGLYIGAKSGRSEQLSMAHVANTVETVIKACVNASPAKAGEAFVTGENNVFVRLSDRRMARGRGTVRLEGTGNDTATASVMRKRYTARGLMRR